MRVTIMFDENKVNVDGDPRFGLPITPVNPNWRVIQWKDDAGTIEVYQGEPERFSDFSVVQPYYDAWVANPPAPEEPIV